MTTYPHSTQGTAEILEIFQHNQNQDIVSRSWPSPECSNFPFLWSSWDDLDQIWWDSNNNPIILKSCSKNSPGTSCREPQGTSKSRPRSNLWPNLQWASEEAGGIHVLRKDGGLRSWKQGPPTVCSDWVPPASQETKQQVEHMQTPQTQAISLCCRLRCLRKLSLACAHRTQCQERSSHLVVPLSWSTRVRNRRL